MSTKKSCKCPICDTESSKVHSLYNRFILDLSIIDKSLSIYLTSRKFVCINKLFHRIIFTERYQTLIIPYARRTHRLNESLKKLAFSMSSEAASRMSKYTLVPLSANTFLRIIRSESIIINSEYENIAIDDFVFHKGITYGTIICDLDTHKPVDLLEDRTKNTLSDWLKSHIDIKIVTRDRSNAYSKAIDDTLPPSAIQIADKFHLLKNMSNNLTEILKSKYTVGVTIENITCINNFSVEPIKPTTKYEIEREALKVGKMKIINKTKKFHKDGVTLKNIMKIVGISKKTVYRYLNRMEAPYSAVKYRWSCLDEYIAEIESAFLAKIKAKDILTLIKEKGYIGSDSLLGMHLSKIKKQLNNINYSNIVNKKLYKREKIAKLFWKHYDQLNIDDKDSLNNIISISMDLSKIYQSVQSYRSIFDQKSIESL
ncbi:ISL3 family transposase [Clostridium psychrophilum]|uniref:ISL3 family transposase n=1 Tax=Clostridium psychrophilum TaxID=132926 RepID=UPI001C0DD0C5|nr:ISL3 family transposase [Clostridium psychrophilum]MBU3183077.1 ISL3 family transposase [Clostridium psychrophilum]